jgi:hypothetical protein
MVETITDEGFFFDTKKRVFELGAQDRPQIRFDDVPKRDVDEINAVLRNMNIPATEENVLRMYSEKLNALRGGNG